MADIGQITTNNELNDFGSMLQFLKKFPFQTNKKHGSRFENLELILANKIAYIQI